MINDYARRLPRTRCRIFAIRKLRLQPTSRRSSSTAAAAAASGGPRSLPFSAATDGGDRLNGTGMDSGGSAGTTSGSSTASRGGLFATFQGLSGGTPLQRRRELIGGGEGGREMAGAGEDGAAGACAGPAKNMYGWDAPGEGGERQQPEGSSG